jgi:hypothetical protein
MRETVAILALLLLAPSGAALAQSDELGVRGKVTGSLGRGQRVRFDVTATHPEGWASIASVGAALELRGAALETLMFEPADSKLSSGTSSVLAGTGDRLDGRFFEVAGTGITITTGGTTMTLRFSARMLAEVPAGARFRFTTVDLQGEEASTSLRAAVPEEEGGGLSLGTVILAVIAALVAGGFFGGQLASSRKPKSSVYSTVARRITDERARAGDRS